jgi:phenylpropionate dioxygenase-like ring-hydroxylating dioxygenase large terminal subunit
MSLLRRSWLLAASSHELDDRPLARRILGQHLVIFRGPDGTPVALEDRCLHRGVPLSCGTVETGLLVCRYHGWHFDRDGACVQVPCAGPDESPPSKRLPRYPTVERQGSIWVCLDERPIGEVPRWPLEHLSGTKTSELRLRFGAHFLFVLHNFFDATHVSFVHPEINARPGPRDQPWSLARARLEETQAGVRVSYTRPRPRGAGPRSPASLIDLLYQALQRSGACGPQPEFRYYEEYVAPTTMRIVRTFAHDRALIHSVVCTPEDETSTRVTIRTEACLPPLSELLVHLTEESIRRLIHQDVQVLEAQTAQLLRSGNESWVSCTADAPMDWLTSAFERFDRGEPLGNPPRSESFDFFL